MVNPNLTTIPNVNEPFFDPRTNDISRTWRLFLQNLFTLTGSGSNSISITDLLVGPTDVGAAESLLASLQSYADTLPSGSPQMAAQDDLNPAAPQAASQGDQAPVYVQTPFPDDLTPVPPLVTGATGTFTTVDLKTVTVVSGIVENIV
jgi:hypothetical protein